MKENHFPFRYLMIFLIIGVCIALAGYKYHKDFEKHFRTDIENQLSLIASLKVGELEHWLEDRRGDAETVFGNEAFARYVKSYLKNPNDKATERDIKVWIKEFQTGFNYDAVKLIDPQLVKKIIIPEAVEQNLAYMVPGNLDSLKAGKLVFEDFYYNELKKKNFLKIFIPILDQHQLIAIIELRIDPKTYLYPMLANWPIPSVTSEAIILRREGNEAVYLNELRFQKNAALNVRIPLNDTTINAVRAVLGYQGLMEGKTYSGNEVVAFAKKVPNSPWFLVAQTEASEIYAPLRKAFWQTMIFAMGIIIIAGLGLGFVWRYQRSLFYKDQIKSAEALRESEERFRSLYENSAMGIYRTTPDGKILLANNTLVKMLGFSDFEDLRSIELDKEDYEPKYDRKQFIDQLEKNGEIIGLEAEWTRKDGTPIYIRESARAIRDSNQKTLYYDGTVEDITEFKKAELERQIIFEILQGVTKTANLNDQLKLIHQSLQKVFYADNYFVALHDQNTGLFSFPYFVDQYDSSPEPFEMSKSCTAYVFHSGKPLLITSELFLQLKEQGEVELVGSPSPSWIGVPLQTPTRTIGVLVLQHYEKENVYSERHVQFLDSVGSQIAMAIERWQADENLRNERLLLRTVIDNIPDSIYCKDIAGQKTLANQTELSYSGANSEADILGKTDFDLYPKELAEGFFADDQIVMLADRPVFNKEEYVFDAKGNKHWLLTSKLPMKDKSGNIIGMVGIGRDISERKQAEESLHTSQQLIEGIINTIPVRIFWKDRNSVYLGCNKIFANDAGFSDPKDIIGKDDFQMGWRDQAELYRTGDRRVMESGNPILLNEEPQTTPEGNTIILLTNKMPLRNSVGEIYGILGTSMDITEHIATVQEIKHKNEQLLKLNNEKDKFFSIVAHDLKSPFNGFLGLTQIMADELPGLTMAQIQEFLVTMSKSATNLYRLLENLLQWSQIQQGAISFNPEVLQLRRIVDESIEMILDPAKIKGIEIENAITDGIALLADNNMLQTIIRNLLSNAIKFTFKGGKVKVSAKISDEKSVEISIQDTGIGMNQTMVDNLFRIDVQANRKGTDGEPSTGLGLLLCKEFVEKNGGRIWAESEVGKGSTFCFTIPVKLESAL